MPIIRNATLKDLPAILDLNHQLCVKEHKEFDKTISPDFPTRNDHQYFKNRITKPKGCALVAVSGKTTVGYLVGAILTFSWRTVKLAELENMFVLPQWRGKGVGRKLTQEFLRWAQKKKAKRARVTASFGNRWGIQFYKQNGFFNHDVSLEKDL